jgi:hypothetical protein
MKLEITMKSTVMNTIKSRAKALGLPLLLASMALLPVLGSAQQSFPTMKGNNGRTGNNGNPVGDNPGAAALKWFSPNFTGIPGLQEIRTVASPEALATGAWNLPIFADQPGNGAWFSAYISGPFVNIANPLTGDNTNEPYAYSFAVPSEALVVGQPYDARVPLAGAASVFDFQISPVGNVARNYALYASIPIGPTVDATGTYYYPPQYFVFEIDYGTGQTYIDIVDRNKAGSGFVRLGNGGGPTNIQFAYDGVNPIHIKLYNTIPRDGTGYLSGVALGAGTNAVNTPPLRPYVIYANAVQAAADYGTINSSPIVATVNGVGNVVYSASNRNVLTNENGTNFTQAQGVLSAFSTLGNPLWTFTPADQGQIGVTVTPPSGAVAASPGWFVGNGLTFPPFSTFAGPEFYYETTTNNAANYDQVTYAPSLATGTYQILMFLPGAQANPTFATQVQVEVDEGATPTVFTVDLTSQQGYVAIGGRRFANVFDPNTGQSDLVVKISNYSALAGDAGKTAFANAVRFVGAENVAINSTPVFANVNIGVQTAGVYSTTPKSVVVTAAEDGRLYCLDAAGNADGTTNVYWVYPSLQDTTNAAWSDPNNSTLPVQPAGYPYADQRDGSNGTTIAEMPTGFDLSSALIQEVPVGSGNFCLYIMSNDGRAYCIDMAGRGDYNLNSKIAGTTARVWTYPSDYQPNSPTTPSQPTALGAGNASIVYNLNVAGPTIFVPAAQGRMYALDATGTVASATTTTRWVYPALNSPTLGALNSTPALDGAPAALYFGTEMKGGIDPGQFFSLDANTGAVNWVFAGTIAQSTASFEGGPATAFNNLVGDGNNYVFVANQNGYVYAFSQAGALLWQTNELNVGAQAPATFTYLTVFDNTGAATALPVPIVMVPSNDGGMYGYFASQASLNLVGGRLAFGYLADGDHIYAGMATGDQWMYGADNHGYLYAFNGGSPGNVGGIGGPGAGVLVPNDPASGNYANASVGFYLGSSYQTLEQDPAPDYNVYTAASNFLVRNPPAFDFGEVLYVMVYDFPYTAGTTVNFNLTVSGLTQRQVPVTAQQWKSGVSKTGTDGTTLLDGYAVLTYPIQPIGSNAMVPGPGDVSFSFNIANVAGRSGRYVAEGNPKTQQIAFILANPLGLALKFDPTFGTTDFGLPNDSIGADSVSFGNPANWQNLFNGAPSNIANTFVPSQLLLSGGFVGDGASGEAAMYAYDRSLMATLNGPDVPGIPNIRVDRGNMAWQGGYGAVYKPFGGVNGLYGGLVPALENWEDYPTQYPNVSLDYSDILRQSLTVTSSRTSAPGNPVFYQVPLGVPNGLFTAAGQPLPQSFWPGRTPNPTEMDLDLAVPAHQPSNLGTGVDTLGVTQQTGYLDRVNIFTDSAGTGQLDSSRDSWRSTQFGVGVPIREHITVLTPNLDLGSLEEGLGIEPANDVNWANANSPWPWAPTAWFAPNNIYKSFQAVNDGNTNLWSVRAARQYDTVNAPNSYFDWPIFSAENDDLAWLDAAKYMYSNLDTPFSASGLAGVLARGENITQKPRPGSTSGTQVQTNPITFLNGNLGDPGGIPLIANTANFPTGQSPMIGVMPPIGMPVGQYQENIDIIEDTVRPDLSVLLGNSTLPGAAFEMYADPTLTLSFNVRESQLTNQSTANSFPQADGFLLNSPIVDANTQPAGMRDNVFGDMIFAWSSNRTDINTPIEVAATNYATRLYFSGIAGSNPSGAAGVSPLDDLAHFGPLAANQWFTKTGPYPLGASSANGAAMDLLFNVGAGNHIVGDNAGDVDTVHFGNPAFPSDGIVNPFSVGNVNTDFQHSLMAFVGSGQIQTPAGRSSTSLLFVAPVTPVRNAAPTVGAPIACTNDPDMPKGRPGVLQVGPDQAVIFYAGGGTGRSRLYYTLYNAGVFSKTVPIDTGVGFDSVEDPSATIRPYQGGDGNFTAAAPNVIELEFAGRLRGRPNSEIFLARIMADQNGAPVSPVAGSTNVLYEYEPQTLETLQTDSTQGLYRSIGANWDTSTTAKVNAIDVEVMAPLGVPTPIITGRIFDSNSGMLTLTTTAGTVYCDTFQGTVKFATTLPGPNYIVYLSYQPRFIRISRSSSTAMSGPQLLWDARYVGTRNYDPNTLAMYDRFWYFGNVHANLTNPGLVNSRYWTFYNRAGVQGGESARPMMSTLRFGIQLPWEVPTTANGDVDFARFTVNGSMGPYQIDPAKGMVYFTAVDEDRTIKFIGPSIVTDVPTLTPELLETPVAMEHPVNDGSVAAFLDPFDPFAPASRRPDMVWLLWSSTRGGTSDIYFQTIAPILWPLLK